MIKMGKILALGVTAVILAASAAAAESPETGSDVGAYGFATSAGGNVRDIRLQTGRSVSNPAASQRRGFYGDGFGDGFGGYEYD